MGMKQKKIQNGRLKKTEIFKTANSWKIFAKISWIGPWISSIDWCEDVALMWLNLYGHEAVRRKLKNRQKIHFFVVFSFPWKSVKVSWLARLGQNFDQAKRDNTFWPRPNIMHPFAILKTNISCYEKQICKHF